VSKYTRIKAADFLAQKLHHNHFSVTHPNHIATDPNPNLINDRINANLNTFR